MKIEFLTLEEMINTIIEGRNGTVVEATEIGRFLQLISAAGLKISSDKTSKTID